MLKLPLKPLGEVAPLGDRRSCVTYMASVTHDAEAQLRLPQILIGNERQLQAQLMRDLGELPANVHVWRQKSAWNCHASMRRDLAGTMNPNRPFCLAKFEAQATPNLANEGEN